MKKKKQNSRKVMPIGTSTTPAKVGNYVDRRDSSMVFFWCQLFLLVSNVNEGKFKVTQLKLLYSLIQ